jgi:hypothetical protein
LRTRACRFGFLSRNDTRSAATTRAAVKRHTQLIHVYLFSHFIKSRNTGQRGAHRGFRRRRADAAQIGSMQATRTRSHDCCSLRHFVEHAEGATQRGSMAAATSEGAQTGGRARRAQSRRCLSSDQRRFLRARCLEEGSSIERAAGGASSICPGGVVLHGTE